MSKSINIQVERKVENAITLPAELTLSTPRLIVLNDDEMKDFQREMTEFAFALGQALGEQKTATTTQLAKPKKPKVQWSTPGLEKAKNFALAKGDKWFNSKELADFNGMSHGFATACLNELANRGVLEKTTTTADNKTGRRFLYRLKRTKVNLPQTPEKPAMDIMNQDQKKIFDAPKEPIKVD